MQTIYQYILILGSNLSSPIKNLKETIKVLEQKLQIVKKTDIKRTSPLLYTKQSDFFNQGLLIKTNLQENELLLFCKNVEKKIGRKKNPIRYGARVIDIDIVFSTKKKNI